MKAEDLIVQAGTAHGIDLRSVAGNASNTKGAARKRRRSRKERQEHPSDEEDVKGSQRRNWRALRNFLEELGIGAAGIPADSYGWCAIVWSLNIHRGKKVRSILHHGLLEECQKLSQRYLWDDTVRLANGRYEYYRESLCGLLLLEEVEPAKFRGNTERYVRELGVTEEDWSKDLSYKYQALQVRYQTWHRDAMAHIQRRINGDPEDAEYLGACENFIEARP